jgi:transposase
VTSAKAIMEGKALKEKSRVEQFERIRRDQRDEGLSVRALAARHGVHRRTVRQALADAVPPAPKAPVRVSPALGPHAATVRGWLLADVDAPRKQRHTARRVWQRLIEEQGAQVAESSVRAMVADLKVEVGLDRRQVSVPQTHPPGVEAEVDFGEFKAVIAGIVVKLWMFVLRLSHSGKAVHVAYANQAQESFLDGHVRAFAALGGVPTGMIRYDNLTPAVVRVLLGRARWENERFVGLRSHYGYDSFFCLPGIAGAHEKGGVEGEIGRFRRRHLTPVPHAASLAALNEAMAAADTVDDARRIAARLETVGQAAARELGVLRPLPVGVFDVSAPLSCRVDAKARICVRQSYYSVPARLAGRRVEAGLGASTVIVWAEGRVVAEHPRSLHKGTEDLVLDHYLEILVRKPGAMAGATALAAARTNGAFTDAHQVFWDAARRALGDGPGTRALIGALLLHRTMPAHAVLAGMAAATTLGRHDPDLVAVEARRHLTAPTTGSAVPVTLPALASPAARADTDRPAPSLRGYDDLLDDTLLIGKATA